MTKHKLDQATEDILQHYGIKGMKWDVVRTKEQIDAAAAGGAEALEDAGDEVFGNDDVSDEIGDVLDIIFGGEGDLGKETAEAIDATKDKIEDISADVKKRGAKMLERMFGKSKATTKVKNPITGKEKTVKESDITSIKNPLTGKPIVITNKNGQKMELVRKKFKKYEKPKTKKQRQGLNAGQR